jgi:hypothetical protein
MKRLIKAALKPLWRRAIGGIRPVKLWFEETVARSLRPTETLLVDESRFLMEHVVRELVRLQRQVQELEDAVGCLGPAQREAGEEPQAERLKAS